MIPMRLQLCDRDAPADSLSDATYVKKAIESFDVTMFADSLTYVGLTRRGLLAEIGLRRSARFAFTAEELNDAWDETGFRIERYGRYNHLLVHVECVLPTAAKPTVRGLSHA